MALRPPSQRALITLLIVSLNVPPSLASEPYEWVSGKFRHATKLEKLAKSVDKLERQIDEYGSVVIKQPDVWGEARWTSHRQEYEKQLAAELGKFRFTLNASVSEADTSFALTAASLGAALSGDVARPDVKVDQVFTAAFPQPQFAALPVVQPINPQTGDAVNGITIEPTIYLDQLSRYVQHLHHLRRINEGDDTADAAGYALNLIRIPVSILPGKKTRTGYGAEVTISLTPELRDELLPETFKDLVTNDLIDQLGLPLVRLAEAKPWENAVVAKAIAEETAQINGILCSLAEILRMCDWLQTIKRPTKDRPYSSFCDVARRIDQLLMDVAKSADAVVGSTRKVVPSTKSELEKAAILAFREQVRNQLIQQLENRDSSFSLDKILQIASSSPVSANCRDTPLPVEAKQSNGDDYGYGEMESDISSINEYVKGMRIQIDSITTVVRDTVQLVSVSAQQALAAAGQDAAQIVQHSMSAVASPRIREARYPIPPTQIACVFGEEQLECLAKKLVIFRQGTLEERTHLFHAQSFLGEELDAAYEYLGSLREKGYDAWESHSRQIVDAIQLLKLGRGTDSLSAVHDSFCQCAHRFETEAGEVPQVPAADNTCPCPPGDGCDVCSTRALAWAILVESALLNERLYQDMLRVEKANQTAFLPGYNPNFYGPDPTPEAREIFKTYVQTRWPIHVFALDPMVQEQNVADAYARRRETQLALSLAFASGQISANTFNRFARRVDFELETISLNRTIVGFSHGHETFGWRFYPRVQVPPTPSNGKAMWQTWVAGPPSRDMDLMKRQLEPGPRELLAVVIMPSFVPYVRADVRSNWFALTNPKHKQFTTEDSVRLGRDMQELRVCKAACIDDGAMYRPGDIERVLRSVDQLEARLPLQDARMQVPYENEFGGYQLFALGTRNLGPELIGFYGHPGVNVAGDTNLFLVGRGFNVNFTQVVAGGQDSAFELISREVMMVTIKKGALVTEIARSDQPGQKEKVVAVHVATAYGVSGPLYIPVVNLPTTGPSFAFKPLEVSGCLGYDGCVANSLTLELPALELSGVKDAAATARLKVSAILSDGREKGLTFRYQPAPSTPVVDKDEFDLGVQFNDKAVTSVSQSSLASMVAAFLSGKQSLLATDGVIALKVTGSVVVPGNAPAALAAPLLIRVGGAQAGAGCLTSGAAIHLQVPACPCPPVSVPASGWQPAPMPTAVAPASIQVRPASPAVPPAAAALEAPREGVTPPPEFRLPNAPEPDAAAVAPAAKPERPFLRLALPTWSETPSTERE